MLTNIEKELTISNESLIPAPFSCTLVRMRMGIFNWLVVMIFLITCLCIGLMYLHIYVRYVHECIEYVCVHTYCIHTVDKCVSTYLQ